MTAEYDKIAENFGQSIRKILKSYNVYDNNIEFCIKIGRYKIEFERQKGNLEVLTMLPNEVFDAAKNTVKELNELWENEPNEEEQLGDHSRTEYSVSIYVDGDPFELHDSGEIIKLIERLTTSMNEDVVKDDFESAGRLKKRISELNKRLKN